MLEMKYRVLSRRKLLAIVLPLVCAVSVYLATKNKSGLTRDFHVVQKNTLEEDLLAWNPDLGANYLTRVRMDSEGTCLYLHYRARNPKEQGRLVRVQGGKKELVSDKVPADHVWWNDSGEIVATSEETSFSEIQGKGEHIVQLKGNEFRFGSANENSMFDVSEDGEFIYVISFVDKPMAINLQVMGIDAPQRVLLEKEYPEIPRIYARSGKLHVFSHLTRGTTSRYFLHEILQIGDGDLSLTQSAVIKAKGSLYFARYSLFAISGDASFAYVYCGVELPFTNFSYHQRISLNVPHDVEKLPSFGPGPIIPVPSNWYD